MALQFSLAHLHRAELSPPEMVEIASRTGYDFVSLRPISFGLANEPRYPLGEDRDLLRHTKAALDTTDVKLLDIELARIYPEVDVKGYLPAMEAAAELGGRHVLTSGWSPDREFVLACFAELCDLAKPFGLTVDFEFVTFSDVATLADAVDVVGRAGRDNGGIMVDTLHFDRSGNVPADLEAVPRSWFHFAQICDGPKNYRKTKEGLIHVAREERLFLGEGGVPVADILAHMPRIPYSLELPNDRLADMGFEEFARRCIDTARQYLHEHLRI